VDGAEVGETGVGFGEMLPSGSSDRSPQLAQRTQHQSQVQPTDEVAMWLGELEERAMA
jgi:hypothetical protein